MEKTLFPLPIWDLNAVFIEQRMPQSERLIKLDQIAIHQISVLESNNNDKKLQ